MASHYNDPITETPAGNSRNYGDATPAVIQTVINTIVQQAQAAGLANQDIANLLALAKIESGFNPSAANKSSSASGVFQMMDGTGQYMDQISGTSLVNGYTVSSSYAIFNLISNVQHGIEYYIDLNRMTGNASNIASIYKLYNPSAADQKLIIPRLQADSADFLEQLNANPSNVTNFADSSLPVTLTNNSDPVYGYSSSGSLNQIVTSWTSAGTLFTDTQYYNPSGYSMDGTILPAAYIINGEIQTAENTAADTLTGESISSILTGDSAQIAFLPSGVPSTATVVSSNGSSLGNYVFSGSPTVTVETLPGTLSATSTSNLLIDPGFGGTLQDLAPGNFFIDLSNGGSIDTGANAQVGAFGDDTTVTNTGVACTDGINCNGDIVNSNSGTIDLGSSDSAITINGSSDLIALGGDDSMTLASGTGNVVDNDDAGDSVYLDAGTGVTVGGGSGAVDLSGSNVTLTTSDETVYGVKSDQGDAITGNDDTVYESANNTFDLTGASDTVAMEGTVDSLFLLSGSGNVVDGDVAGDTVDLSAGTGATVGGSDGNIFLAGSSVTLTTNDEAISGLVSGDKSESVTGTGDTIFEDPNNAFNVAGGSNTIDLTGTADSASILSGAGNIVDNDDAGDLVSLDSNTSTTFTGSGGTIDVDGTGITATATDETAYETAGASFGLAGGSDTISMGGTADTAILFSGSGYTVDGDDASDTANLEANTAATITGTGGTIGFLGSGVAVTTSNETINTLANDQSEDITGTGITLDEAANNSASVWDGSDTVDMTSATDSVTLSTGSSYTVDSDDAGDIVSLDSNTSATIDGYGGGIDIDGTGISVTASNETADEEANGSFNLAGGGDTVNLYGSGDYLGLLGGSGYSVNATDATVATSADTSFNLAGGGDTVNLYGSGAYLGLLGGSGYSVNATDATVATSADTSFNLAGGDDTVNLYGSGGYLGLLGGSGYSVNATDATVATTADTSFNLAGGDDTANLGGSGDYLGLLGGSDYSVNATGATVATWADTSFNLAGGDDMANLGSGDYLGLLGGSGYSVTAAEATIATWADTSFNLAGGGDTADLGSGDYLGLLGGSGYSVNATDATVATWADTSFNLAGGDDTANLGGGDYLGLLGGSGYSVTAAGATIATSADTSFNLAGGDDTADLGSGDYLGLLGGSGYSVSAADATIVTSADTSFSFGGSDDTLHIGNDVVVTIDGNDDTIDGGSDDTIVDDGYDDTIDGNSSDDMDYVGGDYTGDTETGGVVLTGGGTDSGGDSDNGSGSGCNPEPGLVANAPTYVDVVAENDIAAGLTTQAALAQADWSLSMQAIAAAAYPTTVAAPSPFEGATWSGSVVTWSFATGSGSEYNPLSGTVQPQYQEAIEQALQTWANATGLTFQEVPDSKASDIRIGWEDLDTSTTGVIGATSIMPVAGAMQPDVEVRLEDPAQDPLASGSGGALTYSGTETTLYQAALHEIGHALGLGASSDPDSIMYPELGTSNPTIDVTDMANVTALYGDPSGRSAAALLVQAMASFGGVSPAVATSIPPPPPGGELTIAPAAVH
jgi:hypothetical protein